MSENRKQPNARKIKKAKKRNALVISHNGAQFWTTQQQFWQWVRSCIVVKTQDHPLTGTFRREHEESMIVLNNAVLNLAAPNHLREVARSQQKLRR